MKNFVQKGDVITLTAPYQRNAGEGAQVGSIFGIACSTVANAAEGEFAVNGVFDVTKLTTDVVTQGALLYWDNTNKRLTITASTHKLVGVAVAAASGTDTTARIRLNGAFIA